MLGSAKDPLAVSFSNQVYQWLLTLYPPRFYREYAGPMQQVFRDYSLKTYAAEGPLGMLWLWGLTLFDLFKSLVEEHLQKETHMSNAKFIRLSGWAMIAGMVVIYLSGNIVPYELRLFLWRAFKIPGTAELIPITNAAGSIVTAIGFLLVDLGLMGMIARYGNSIEKWGKLSLQISLLGPIAIAFSVFMELYKPYLNYEWWMMFFYGAWAMMILLSIFGIAVLRSKPLPYWNALPLLVGLPLSLWMLAILVFPSIPEPVTDMGFDISGWWALLGSLLLGYILQSDAVRQET